jgi:dsDNA-specific endonuclease/ATPase MutS2
MAYGLRMGNGEEKYYPDPIHAIEITDVFDLHVFAPRDVVAAVEAYLDEACSRGFDHVRIIHGKGIGYQRERVRKILEKTPFVVDFRDAPLEAGGWGATLVTLDAAVTLDPAKKKGAEDCPPHPDGSTPDSGV